MAGLGNCSHRFIAYLIRWECCTGFLWGAALFLGCVAAARPVSCFGQDRVTVEQLEQRLAAGRGRSDKDLAHRLENLELTERLSLARLERLEAGLPGPESRSELLAVADLSEVRGLPAAEVPSDPQPSAAEQQQMLERAYAAAEHAAGTLPDFDATGNITRLRNLKVISTAQTSPIPVVVPVPLVVSLGGEGVSCRDGRVIITQSSKAWAPQEAVKAGLESWDGVFPLLDNVLRGMRGAEPEWARWEQGALGRVAVFRFTAGAEHANFPVRTVMEPAAKRGFAGSPGYRGEVSLDPTTGAVQRLVVRAMLEPGQHVSRADVVVEFGRVTVEGKLFLGPLRAVTIGVSQSLVGYNGSHYEDFDVHANLEIRPLTHVVDVEFTDYRKAQTNAPAKADPGFLAGALQVTGERVTVEQLEEVVASLRADDQKLAQRLGQLELTQRLTAERYTRMRAQLSGKASEDGLLALYDLSAFADLPASDVADGAPPDAAMQGKIVTSAVEFVANVTHKMPDLFATRQLARFEDLHVVRGSVEPLTAEVKPLAMMDESTGTVHFREGREVVEVTQKTTRPKIAAPGLDTWGTFGPILEIVMADVLKAKIGWGHWEHGPAGRLAVFRFAVPKDASHYQVRFCCYLADNGMMSSFEATPGYHGELAIDPQTGAVVRLVLKADFKEDPLEEIEPVQGVQATKPVLRSDVLVEYGGVDIAGKQYNCPTRTVSVLTSWTLGGQGPLKERMSQADGAKAAKKALALMEFSRVNAINEAMFRDYHVFRSEMRIVDGKEQGPGNRDQ